MKLLELEIQNIRGIKNLFLKPNGKNYVIYGPNGSGKSAVVDAIDFLLTGRISRLTGEGTGEISLREHGPHIDHQPDEAFVRGIFKLTDVEDSIELQRCIGYPSILECDEEVKDCIEPVIELAKRGQYVLTRKEILKYITAPPNDRAVAIQTLLNIQDIEKIRKKLVKIRNNFYKEHKAANKVLEKTTDALIATMQIDTFNEEALLEFINQNRAVLGGIRISNFHWNEIRHGIKTPIEYFEANQIKSIEKDIQNLLIIISNQNQQKLSKLDKELRSLIKNIIEKPELIGDLDRLTLTELGLKLIEEPGNCPLCDTKWEKELLEEKLNQKIISFKKVKEIDNKIEYISKKLKENIYITISSIERIINLPEHPKIRGILPVYKNWYNSLLELATLLNDSLYEYVNSQYTEDMIRVMLAPSKIFKSLQIIQSYIQDDIPISSSKQRAWDNLIRIEENLKLYEGAKREFLCTKSSFERADLLSNSFQQAKDNILTNLYEEIRDKFVELYKILHKIDEENFTAEIKPEKAGLNIEVDFYGHGTHPPHALHSEGHQDSMGVCLYLTLAERVNLDLIDLVILDDVVMSVDIDHRKRICNVLNECFPNNQILITTHDKTWTNQLKSERVVNPEDIIEFYNWDINTGPHCINYQTNMWAPIERDLENNDISSAAARLRRGLEEFFGTVCNELCVPVVYKLSGRYELGDFLIPSMNEFRSLLKRGKESARSWNNENLVEKITEMDSIRSQVYNRTYVERWTINSSVHYNNWMNLSSNEFRPVVEAFHDLCLLFCCSNCGGLIYLAKQNHKSVSVRCNCGAININLVKKAD